MSFFLVKDASIFAGAQVVALLVLLPGLVAGGLLHDGGVDDGAPLDQQPPALDVPQDRREDHLVQLRLPHEVVGKGTVEELGARVPLHETEWALADVVRAGPEGVVEEGVQIAGLVDAAHDVLGERLELPRD